MILFNFENPQSDNKNDMIKPINPPMINRAPVIAVNPTALRIHLSAPGRCMDNEGRVRDTRVHVHLVVWSQKIPWEIQVLSQRLLFWMEQIPWKSHILMVFYHISIICLSYFYHMSIIFLDVGFPKNRPTMKNPRPSHGHHWYLGM